MIVPIPSKSVVPPKLPIFVCKASWGATSVTYLTPAKNEQEAWDRTWKKVAKAEGGDRCLTVTVLRRKD